MSQTRTFDCPSCGASLKPDGAAAQVKCPYCGKIVVVPPELRSPEPAPAAPPPPVVREREGLERAPAPRTQASRSGGCGLIFPVLFVAAMVGLALFGSEGGTRAVKQAVTRETPVPTVAPFSRSLEGTLPRQVHYASLAFKVVRAVIGNQEPGNSNDKPRYRADRAYATLDLEVSNTGAPSSVFLDQGLVQLQTGDGKLYPEQSGWLDAFEPQSSKDVRLVYNVPPDTTWKGAKLVMTRPNKEPAELPLDGPTPVEQYPLKLPLSGQATADKIIYKIQGASLDLDYNGERADLGKRYLRLAMRLDNTSTFAGGVAVSGANYRLLVDDRTLAPLKAPIEAMAPSSSLDGEVVFVVSATAASAQLQVGEVGRGELKILPIKLPGK